MHQVEGGADGLPAVSFGIPDQAEARGEQGQMGCRERFAVVIFAVAGEDQSGRRLGIYGAVPTLHEQGPAELVPAAELVVSGHGRLPPYAEVDRDVARGVEGVLG